MVTQKVNSVAEASIVLFTHHIMFLFFTHSTTKMGEQIDIIDGG